MPDVDLDAVAQLLCNLAKVISTARMYSVRHPAVVTATDDAIAGLESLLKHRHSLTLGTREGTMLVEEIPLPHQVGPVRSLAETMTSKGLHSVTLRRGTTPEELAGLAEVVAMKVEEIQTDGEIRPEILKRFQHVELNRLRYQLVDANAPKGRGPGGGPGGSGDGDGTGGVTVNPATIANAVGSAVAALLVGRSDAQAEDLKQQIAEAVTGAFFQQAGAGCEGVADLQDNISQVALMLDPGVQLRLFGKRLGSAGDVDLASLVPHMSTGQKAGVLAHDILNPRLSREELADAVKAMTSDEGEIVDMAEAIASRVAILGRGLRDQRGGLGKFLDALRTGTLGAAPRNKVVIVAGEPEMLQHYGAALPADRFTAVTFTTPQAAQKHIQKEQPDLVIADSTLSSQTGLAVITLMYHAGMQIPLIACADYAEFAQKPVFRYYPNGYFLLSPVSEEALRATVQEIFPISQEEANEREDLRRARLIQEHLLPKELPTVPHFDVGTFYKACKDIGGDYYDVFPLSDTTYGIVIADVSGKRVSGALVMVMFRTLFRLAAQAGVPPKKVLVKVNEMLSDDIKRGMFVTALYMQLDTETDTLTMCNAGHNPAVFWRESDLIKPQMLIPSGMALGIMRGSAFADAVKERAIQLMPNDLVFLYTDGITEAMNEAGDEFETGRLLQTIARTAAGGACSIVQQTLEAVDRFTGTADQLDDISIIALKHAPEAKSERMEPVFAE